MLNNHAKSRIKWLFSSLLIAVMSCICFLMLLELTLRLGLIHNTRYDQLKCTGELSKPRHKILVIGDSYARWLKSSLDKELMPFDVILRCIGLVGNGPFGYAMEMKTQEAAFRPDITIVTYFTGNDLTNTQDSRWNKPNLKTRIAKTVYPFLRELYTYYFIKEKTNILFPKVFNYEKFLASGMDEAVISLIKKGHANAWLLEASLKNKNYFFDNILMDSKGNTMTWEKIKQLLSEIKERCDKIKSEFVIIIFPSTVQVNRSQYGFYKKLKFNIDDRLLSSNKPQKLLKEFCAEKNIPCLDLLTYFKVADKELYRANDDHLNEAGNRLSARIIIDFLLKTTHLKESAPPS